MHNQGCVTKNCQIKVHSTCAREGQSKGEGIKCCTFALLTPAREKGPGRLTRTFLLAEAIHTGCTKKNFDFFKMINWG